MWQMINNEWRYYLRSKLFLGVSIAFAVVLVLAAVLGRFQIEGQFDQHEQASRHLRGQWEKIDAMNPHSAAHYGTYVFKPVSLMTGLDEGVTAVTGNVLRIEGHVQNEIVYSEASQYKTVSRFGKLRGSLLLQYVVPLLLILLAFASVSSEKESGRLKLLVLQGASPTRLVLAKTISVWLIGIVLLILVFAAYLLLNTSGVSTDSLLRAMLFFVAYGAYYFVISGLTVFLSTRGQNATLALTSMLAIWIVWTVFVPAILISSLEEIYPLPSRDQFKTAMQEDRSKGLDGHNPTDERNKALQKKVLAEYEVDSLSQLPINFDGIRMQADEEYGNIVWDKHFGNIRFILTRQKQMTQLAGIANPFLSLRNASMGFAGSDNLHHHGFLVQAENFRRVFIKFLNDEHTYGGSKTGDWGWKADNAFFKSAPEFQFQPPQLQSMLSAYAADLVVLILWMAATTGLLIIATRNMTIK